MTPSMSLTVSGTSTRRQVAAFTGICVRIAGCLALSAVSFAADEAPNKPPGIAPLFADNSLLEVSIEAPLTSLMTERPDEEYFNGIFRFIATDGTELALDLKLRTRGNYRRQEEHCDFAPIRLNFRTRQVVGTVFSGQDKLKMVTHCENGNPRYEQLLLREYLAYRILNKLTKKSFSVRLMRVNYIDTEGSKPMKKLGFVIEDDDDVAARNGMRVIKTGDITSDDLDEEQQNLVNLFQYLIGNTEYSLFRSEPNKDCCHNADLMAVHEDGPYTPLPYDFDFAGIVNAPYAQPNPRYDLQTVRQRLYKGRCVNNHLLPGTIQKIREKKDAIYDLIDELELLSARSRRDMTRYLNSFYRRISTPESIKTRFVEKCIFPKTKSL